MTDEARRLELMDEFRRNIAGQLERLTRTGESLEETLTELRIKVEPLLANIARLEGTCGTLQAALGRVQIDVGKLQVKAGLWGLLGGLIAGVGMTLLAMKGG